MVTPGRPKGRASAVRVMHVVHALQPGGMEFGIVKLVNGLDPQRVHSAVCSTRPAGVVKDQLAAHIPLFELDGRKGNDIRVVARLHRLFRREQPDVVHTHGWGTLVEGLVAAKMAGVPVVIHGEHGTLQLRPYQRIIQRAAWGTADRVLSVSSRLAERMASEMSVGIDRITTIRNGVDLVRFCSADRAAARASLGLSDAPFVVGTVGRLVPVKDHATLVEAVAILRRGGADISLVISGDGPLLDDTRRRAATLGIEGCVRMLGHRHDVEVVLAAMDVFVLSSLSEGLSNTILEAMATGLPVVATRVGGADELVDDGVTGLLVAPQSPPDMAGALERLLDDRTRRAMGAAGRRRVEAEFSLRSMVGRYEALYMNLAAEKSGGTSAHRADATSGAQTSTLAPHR